MDSGSGKVPKQNHKREQGIGRRPDACLHFEALHAGTNSGSPSGVAIVKTAVLVLGGTPFLFFTRDGQDSSGLPAGGHPYRILSDRQP